MAGLEKLRNSTLMRLSYYPNLNAPGWFWSRDCKNQRCIKSWQRLALKISTWSLMVFCLRPKENVTHWPLQYGNGSRRRRQI